MLGDGWHGEQAFEIRLALVLPLNQRDLFHYEWSAVEALLEFCGRSCLHVITDRVFFTVPCRLEVFVRQQLCAADLRSLTFIIHLHFADTVKDLAFVVDLELFVQFVESDQTCLP